MSEDFLFSLSGSARSGEERGTYPPTEARVHALPPAVR